MTPPLPTDCLNGIFKCLLDDAYSLHSCLLVNRLWCEIAIPLLWNNPWQGTPILMDEDYKKNWPALIRTLLSCLPEESKEILRKNGIDLLLQKSPSKPPLFDYVGYCQYLSPYMMDKLKSITVGENKKNINYIPGAYREHLVEQELYKLFMTRCSLKQLVLPKIPLSYFPGANHCLEYLRDLRCCTERSPELFYGLAHLSRNLHRLTIYPCDEDNEGLVTLIKLQKGLKSLVLESTEDYVSICPKIGQALTSQKHSLSFLKIRKSLCIPEAIPNFINLRTLQLDITTEVLSTELLSRITLPKLEILDIFCDENAPFSVYSSLISNSISASNSSCLQRIYWNKINPPNCIEEIRQYIRILLPASSTLRFLTVWWSEEIQEELYTLLSLCHQLEAIKFCYHTDLRVGVNYLSENLIGGNVVQGNLIFELLKVLSLKNLCILCLKGNWVFTSKELREFLEFWREQQKNPLSLYLLPFEGIELDKIIREYLTNGVLKDSDYKDNLEAVYSLKNIFGIKL